MEKEYTVYFDPVIVYAESKEEAVKLAKEDIKEYPCVQDVIEE